MILFFTPSMAPQISDRNHSTFADSIGGGGGRRVNLDETNKKGLRARLKGYSRKPLELILAGESMKLHRTRWNEEYTYSTVSLISFENDLVPFR